MASPQSRKKDNNYSEIDRGHRRTEDFAKTDR